MPLRCRFESESLTFTGEGALRVVLGRAAPRVVVRCGGRTITWHALPLQPAGDAYEAVNAALGLRLGLRCRTEGDAWVLQVALENRGGAAAVVEELAPLSVGAGGEVVIGAGLDRWAVLRNGYQSWTGTRAFRLDETDRDPRGRFLRISHTDLRHRSAGRAGTLRSDLFTVIKNLRSGEALAVGFLGARSAFGAVRIDARSGRVRELTAACDRDGVDLRPGETVTSEPLWLAAGFDEHALLAAYASALGAAMGARLPDRSPVGWCSWYYYFTRVSEARVLQNLEQLAALRTRVPCDYVQVDDGYQRAIGDWLEANEKFPHGMSWLAGRIRAAGFEAGLWVAPFIARPDSRVFREHPDWLVRTPGGRPRAALWNPAWGWWRCAYALDTTHPEVLEWLRGLFRTLVREWGYRVLKLDFLFAAALPGRRHDRRATRAESLRRGLEAVRAGAGDDAFLLGCGCPLGPAIGVVDAMRVGPDVAPFWSNWLSRWALRDQHGVATKHAIRNTLTRAFMHRRLWLNDPDCLMVRAAKTRLTAEEVRSLAAAIALTDGLFVMSDRMDQLSPDRLAVLERARQLTGGEPTVVDLFERDLPELLVSRRAGERLVSVFNFRDEPVRKMVDLGRFGLSDGRVAEWWSGAHLAVRSGWVDLGELPPHDGRVLCLGPEPAAGRGSGAAPLDGRSY